MFCTIGSDGKGNIKDMCMCLCARGVFKKVLDKKGVCVC